MVDIDIMVKTALHLERPSPDRCISALDELDKLAVMPLMLKKQPDIVTTIRKLRKYIGPEDEPADSKLGEEWVSMAEKIRLRSDAIFHKIQSCFTVPEGSNFWDAFENELMEFRRVTNGMDPDQVLHLVTDPVRRED